MVPVANVFKQSRQDNVVGRGAAEGERLDVDPSERSVVETDERPTLVRQDWIRPKANLDRSRRVGAPQNAGNACGVTTV
jgi:hypothetical protein